MSILANRSTRLLVQGITGKHGSFHTLGCRAYGTNVVAGVTPGKGGTMFHDIPVFNTVQEAVLETGANATMIFVPPQAGADAICEAAEAGVGLIVAIPDGIPVNDMLRVKRFVAQKNVQLIGPNCAGVVTPEECKIGPLPGHIHKKGSIGVIARSGTLTYEAIWQLTEHGLGQSTSIGIGADPIRGLGFLEIFKLFEADPETEGVLMMGEIGGTEEAEVAVWIKENMTKPVVAFIAGLTAPVGQRMGHAGAMIFGEKETGASKVKALREAGVTVVEDITQVGDTAFRVFQNLGKGNKVPV